MHVQWKNEVNSFLANSGWKLYHYQELKFADPIPELDLFLTIRAKETLPNTMLALKEFGVIGVVKNRKVLDVQLRNTFLHFMTDGYEADNNWWKHGKFDKIAKFGVLLKKGKNTLSELHYPHPTSPIYVLENDAPKLTANILSIAIKTQVEKLSENQKFADSTRANLNIELLTALSDISNMHFRIATQDGSFDKNIICLQELRHQTFLLAHFVFQQFPTQNELTIAFRNTYLEANRYLVETSKLHTIWLTKKAIDLFTNTLFGKSAEIKKIENKMENRETSRKILAFIQSHENVRTTSTRPVDK